MTVLSKPSRLLPFQHSRKKLLSTRLMLFLSGIPYLNHTCGPAFAVHPRTSAIFSQQEDKSEPAARRPQASCPSFRIYLYRIGCLQVHRPFRNFGKFLDSKKASIRTQVLYCHSATVSASSVIPGFLRLKARRIGWHPCIISAAKPIPHRVLSIHRLTDEWPSIVASGRAVPFAANDSATWVSCWRFPPPFRTSLSGSRSSRRVSSPVQAEHFPTPRSTGVLCSSSWPQA